VGGKLHLMLRMCSRPIEHKYHEGKMKRTLERELKVIEIAEWEADGSSEAEQLCCALCQCSIASMQVAQCCSRLFVQCSFALFVNHNSQLRNRVVMCAPRSGKDVNCHMTCLGIDFGLFNAVLSPPSVNSLICAWLMQPLFE
jgi:hypothetical protein